MSTILVTGASGFVGGALARSMAEKHRVVCLSRKPTHIPGATCLRGAFHVANDLLQLSDYEFDVCVHLAAVTGGGAEEDFIPVNVEGTRRLMRALIDRGCRKFVNASSIAAVGFQSPKFRPLAVPIPDEHPCFDRNGYGLSKALMEDVTRYLWRQDEDIDVINIRLATVIPDDATPTPRAPGPIGAWHLGGITLLYLSDAVRCFTMAAEAPRKLGVRVMNAVGKPACVACTVPEILTAWYKEDADHLDFSWFERPGHERDPVFRIERIREEIGFIPERPIPV